MEIVYNRTSWPVAGCPDSAQRECTPDHVGRALDLPCATAGGFSPVGESDQ